MRGVSIGQRALTTGVATIAVAGLIAATPPVPQHQDVVVSHRAVVLTAAPSVQQSGKPLWDLVIKLAAAASATTVVVVVGAVPLTVTAAVLTVVDAAGLLEEPTDWLKEKFLEQFPIDRVVAALPRELKAEGEVIARVLAAQRLENLKDFDTFLTTLENLVDQRQKFTDKQLSKAKVNLTAALSVVGSLVGYQVPPTTVYSWFDQADARIDRAYDSLDDRLDKLQAQIDKLIESASSGAKSSARLAGSKTPSTKQSAASATKTATGARSARQAKNPAAANRPGKTTKSTSTHARSARAAR